MHLNLEEFKTHAVHIPGENHSFIGSTVSVLAEYKPLQHRCMEARWQDRLRMALKSQDLGTEDLGTRFVVYPTLNADTAVGSST